MDSQPNKYTLLDQKLQSLIEHQALINREIVGLQEELNSLKAEAILNEEPIAIQEPENRMENNSVVAEITPIEATEITPETPSTRVAPEKTVKPAKSFSLERFIGENLINKIGIIILLIGVAIGTKYAIENQLINQFTRIIIGYTLGTLLLLTAIKLKKNFEAFSAVLLSGALAIFYFITYAAYSFYQIIPLPLTFVLLLIFTTFTVVAAINYNKQIIAHIGLVGAYAIPILLSSDSGRIGFLLSYVSLINIGILAISIKRYWKGLFISAFAITWLQMLIWRNSDYMPDEHLGITAAFTLLFFVLFFVTFLIYKLVNKVAFQFWDVLLIITNSFVFYGIGYSLIYNNDALSQYTGLFTLLTALIHFIFSFVVYLKKLVDRNLLYLISGLVLTFLTITFPVQFNGSWVTLLWAGETAFLFWIGRNKGIKFYEYLSYALILLTFFSIVQDWSAIYGLHLYNDNEISIRPFLNISFLSSLMVSLSFAYVFFLNRNKKPLFENSTFTSWQSIMNILIPSFLILTVYFSIRLEIANYWNQLYHDSEITLLTSGDDPYPYSSWNTDLKSYKKIWLINFTLLFVSAISWLNVALKSKAFYCWINQVISIALYPICFAIGLWEISELRESYLLQEMAEYYDYSYMNMTIRYITIIFLTTYILSIYRLHIYLQRKSAKLFDLFVATALLWFLSSELLHWLDIYNAANSYKIAISIFWGIYSISLVAFGIWKNKAHIRIMSFATLGITLLKMFFYDLSHLSTLSKSLIFIAIGILMLGISFLYNKYKSQLFDDAKD